MTFLRRKRKDQQVCKCEAYPFPHRTDSKQCRELYNSQAIDRLENAYQEFGGDGIDTLGLRALFAPDNSNPIRN